jgi:CRISPR/Cas system-associated endonuclease/helicase Cas3
MCTFVAPIDLLIQRFGRVWRHSDIGTVRETENIETPIRIIIPMSENELPSNIYNKQVLLNSIKELQGRTIINTVTDARLLIDAVYNSKELIDNMVKNMRAETRLIDSPYDDNMFYNSVECYVNFNLNRPVTRDADYPTVQMALVTPEEITDVDFKKIKHIMLNKTVVIASYKLEKIEVPLIDTPHEWLSEVRLYDETEMANRGICLSTDGLIWDNN